MQLLKKLPDYNPADFVADSMGDHVRIDILAPGYTVDDITIEARENGIAVVGNPKKTIGGGRLLKGFTNFFDIVDPKKFDRKAASAEIFNGILTIKVPVLPEFQSIKIEVKQVSGNA